MKAFNHFRKMVYRRCWPRFWKHLCILAMFKSDSWKNRLKHEISLKWTIKPPEQNRKNRSITVNKHMFKVHDSDNWFWVCISLLGKNCPIILELNKCFRITITKIEDNPNSKIYGKHIRMQVMLIYNLVL